MDPRHREKERNEIILRMAERGVACNVHYKPLPMMTAYKAMGFDPEELCVVSPDVGRAKAAKKFSTLLDCDIAIMHKDRPKHNQPRSRRSSATCTARCAS